MAGPLIYTVTTTINGTIKTKCDFEKFKSIALFVLSTEGLRTKVKTALVVTVSVFNMETGTVTRLDTFEAENERALLDRLKQSVDLEDAGL